MDGNDYEDASYPDPGATFVTPYPSGYQQDEYAYGYQGADVSDYYPPVPQPLMHEGFIPQSTALPDLDEDEDPSNSYDTLRAQFGLNFVLNPKSADPRLTVRYEGEGEDDSDLESEPAAPRSRLNSLDRELLDGNDETVDPDFAMSDEDRSSDSMSITSDVLDDLLNDVDDSGRGRGRGRGKGRGRGRGRRGWKWAIKGTEHDESRARGTTRGRPRGSRARGNQVPRGEGRQRGRQKGANGPVEPDPEFKRLQALATQNFLNQNLEAAADYARDAVKANPEIFAAHSLLSEILLAEGKEQDSLTVLLAGAHTRRDPALWWHVAERTLELAGDDRSQTMLEQAIYCYAWAIKLDPEDFDARREKLNLLLESEQFARARGDCKMMVRQRPHDLSLIKQYADLAAFSTHSTEIQRAKEAYQTAIDFFSKGRTLGLPETQWSHLNVYLDLVESSETPARAVLQLKKLSRWLLGRKEDTFWDDVDYDDREYDMEDVPRRTELEAYMQSRFFGQKSSYGEGLPLELRVKLGMFRAKMGTTHLAEAMQHFQSLIDLQDYVAEYHDLFKDVADVLEKQQYYQEAIIFYEPMRAVPEACDYSFFMTLAKCYLAADRKADAMECYKIVVDNDAEDIESRIALAKLYEAEQRMAEAIPLVHEVIRLGRTDAVKKAKINVNPPVPPKSLVPAPRRRKTTSKYPATTTTQSMTPEATPDAADSGEEEDEAAEPTLKPRRRGGRKAKAAGERAEPKISERLVHLQMQGQRIQENYAALQACREEAEEGDADAQEHWMTAASGLLEDFRSMKVFYPGRDKHIKFTGYGRGKNSVLSEAEAMRKRLEGAEDDNTFDADTVDDGIPDEFHDIKFTAWLDVFCEYALNLARDDDREQCYDTLQSAFFASVFYHNTEAKIQIHATWLACALMFNDEQTLCNASRWFLSEFPHSSAPYQLFASVNRLFAGSANWFNSGPTQKFILRSVKAIDYALLDPASRLRYAFTATERSSYTHAGKRDANKYGLIELDPAILALYGHIMAAAQSWTSALNYYFRVFTLDQENITINLCIALSYVQMAMKRQSENRHWQIYQGLAFFERYYQLRYAGGIAVELQEAEYNRGRVFHMLGLNLHAVPAYEKCLQLAEMVREEAWERARLDNDGMDEEDIEVEQEEFTQEAAFALASIYAMADNAAAARAVTEKWLVI